ncbi:MAG: amidohydrolase family protein, partial [Terriglobales bacterium]
GDLARLPALAAHGLVASVQPTHFHPVYVETIARVLGPERMRREYPLASLLRAGLPLALNSDWPAAMSFAPMENLRAAVGHGVAAQDAVAHDAAAHDAADGSEALTPAEALHALTWGNAFAARRERDLGAIAAGYCADAVLLDGDPLAMPPPRVRATMIAGEWVWRPPR